MKKLLKLFKMFIFLIALLAIAIVLFVNLHPAFGDSPNEESMARIQQSAHFDGEHFKNLMHTNATKTLCFHPKAKTLKKSSLKN